MQTPGQPIYLLRFDDLCPETHGPLWSEIELVLLDKGLKPLLAVIPDNQDPKLKVSSPAPDFWERVRTWQARGWTIALHGFQHRYVSPHAGLVAVRKKSEFAGLPRAQQEEKLRRGTAILRREGIQPRVWIAPGNSFDRTTVSLLPQFGIRVICDGYFRRPYMDGQGITWIPQQLFSFRSAPTGVWTVCYHHHEWPADGLAKFRAEVDRCQSRISSFEQVVQQYEGRRSAFDARLCTWPRLSRLLVRAQLRLCQTRQELRRKH